MGFLDLIVDLMGMFVSSWSGFESGFVGRVNYILEKGVESDYPKRERGKIQCGQLLYTGGDVEVGERHVIICFSCAGPII